LKLGNNAVTTANLHASLVPDPQNEVIVRSSSGNGTTGIRVKVFNTPPVVNQGMAITYTPDPVNGDTFTINENGVYAISYNGHAGGNDMFGISRNANGGATTTPWTSLPQTQQLAWSWTDGGTNHAGTAAWTGRLTAGDVIRAHQEGTSSGNSDANGFRIVKVNKS
jgi:hypothetical protein